MSHQNPRIPEVKIYCEEDLVAHYRDVEHGRMLFVSNLILKRIEYAYLEKVGQYLKRCRLGNISLRECCSTSADMRRLLRAIKQNLRNQQHPQPPIRLDIRGNAINVRGIEELCKLIERRFIISLAMPEGLNDPNTQLIIRSSHAACAPRDFTIESLDIRGSTLTGRTLGLLRDMIIKRMITKHLDLRGCRNKHGLKLRDVDREMLEQIPINDQGLKIEWFETSTANISVAHWNEEQLPPKKNDIKMPHAEELVPHEQQQRQRFAITSHIFHPQYFPSDIHGCQIGNIGTHQSYFERQPEMQQRALSWHMDTSCDIGPAPFRQPNLFYMQPAGYSGTRQYAPAFQQGRGTVPFPQSGFFDMQPNYYGTRQYDPAFQQGRGTVPFGQPNFSYMQPDYSGKRQYIPAFQQGYPACSMSNGQQTNHRWPQEHPRIQQSHLNAFVANQINFWGVEQFHSATNEIKNDEKHENQAVVSVPTGSTDIRDRTRQKKTTGSRRVRSPLRRNQEKSQYAAECRNKTSDSRTNYEKESDSNVTAQTLESNKTETRTLPKNESKSTKTKDNLRPIETESRSYEKEQSQLVKSTNNLRLNDRETKTQKKESRLTKSTNDSQKNRDRESETENGDARIGIKTDQSGNQNTNTRLYPRGPTWQSVNAGLPQSSSPQPQDNEAYLDSDAVQKENTEKFRTPERNSNSKFVGYAIYEKRRSVRLQAWNSRNKEVAQKELSKLADDGYSLLIDSEVKINEGKKVQSLLALNVKSRGNDSPTSTYERKSLSASCLDFSSDSDFHTMSLSQSTTASESTFYELEYEFASDHGKIEL